MNTDGMEERRGRRGAAGVSRHGIHPPFRRAGTANSFIVISEMIGGAIFFPLAL